MNKPSRVVVLVEDKHHEMLARRYLKERGIGLREMRLEPSPAGEGSAENWVRRQFATEVGAYRRRNAKANTALIVIIDADSRTLQHRLRQLDDAVREAGKTPIKPGEQIARLVPKRNVETWILCLNAQPVDEVTDYKNGHHHWNDLIPRAAAELHKWRRLDSQMPDNFVESLRHGVRELKRLAF